MAPDEHATETELESETLSVRGIRKDFAGAAVWSDVTFEVTPGEIVAITGVSGSGKTTLLNCVGLLEPLSGGSIRIGSQVISNSAGRARRLFFRRTAGFLFQSYGLVDSWSVSRNLDVALEYRKHSRAERRSLKSSALAKVGLDGKEDQRIYTLSGGEQQRVALARLILKRPRLILADEPSAALDKDNSAMVLRVLREQANRRAIVLVATHDQGFADQCTRTLSLT